MSSFSDQFHEVAPRLQSEAVFVSLSGVKKHVSPPVLVNRKLQQGLPVTGRTSPFALSTPNLSTAQSAAYQGVPLSVPSSIKVVNHRSGENTAASLQTLSGSAFPSASLREVQHPHSSGGTRMGSYEATSLKAEERKRLEFQEMQLLSEKLKNKGGLVSVNSLPDSCSRQISDVDLEGEELTICTKHWSQYTPPDSELPCGGEKSKLQVPVALAERCSETPSVLSFHSSGMKPSDCGEYIHARGESLSSCRHALSPDHLQVKRSSNLDRSNITNSVCHYGGSVAGFESLAPPHEKGVMEDSPHRAFTLVSMGSSRVNDKDVSNARESNASADHSSLFLQPHLRPFMRIQSTDSSATNVTFNRALQNDGLRSSVSFADTIDPPRRISFQRGRMIGSGGFGTVYQAILHDGTLAAVKEIKTEPTNLKLIDREVSAMSSLPPHPNCVRYLGSRFSRHHYYIIMDYISGGSISSLRQSVGPFRESVFQRYAYMVLLGLHHLHSHGIIHRDIKGANVLLDEHGCAKIVDFGCCKDLNSGKSTLGGGGTPLWMASEVCRGEGATEKSDVWSFGCLCLEMTNETGLPWNFSSGMTLQGLAYALACAQKPPPIPTTLSPISQDFIACCLRLDPNERWSVSQLLNHDFFNQDYYQQDDDDEDELIVSCNTSAHTSAVKRIVEQVNKGEYAGTTLREANASLAMPQPHQTPEHPAYNFSNPPNPNFPKGLSNSTRSPLQSSSIAPADVSMSGYEGSKGHDSGSSKPACPNYNHVKENDQRLRTVNMGFRLDVVDDSEDGSDIVRLDMHNKKSNMYIKEDSSPSNERQPYYAALDDVIALAHRARTEEERTGEAPSTPTLSLTKSSSSSSYLDPMLTSCSDNAEVGVPSDNSKTAIPAGRVGRQRKIRRVKKTHRSRVTKTDPSAPHTKNGEALDPVPVTQRTASVSFCNSISNEVDNAVTTTGKYQEKVRGSKDIMILSTFHDSNNAMSGLSSEASLRKKSHISEPIFDKNNKEFHKPQQEPVMTTFVSTPLGPSKEQSFLTENQTSVGTLYRQPSQHLLETPGHAPSNTSPLSKLVWSTSGSGSISKELSGTLRESHPVAHYARSSATQSLNTCENYSINEELVSSAVLQPKKKQKKFAFKWFQNKF